MPRAAYVKFSLAAGEVAPTIYARSDIDKYTSAAQVIENYLPIPQGGVTRRAGTRFVAEVKDSSKLTIVRRFEFSTTQAYILELGCGYMRFYKNSARIEASGSPIERTTPYDDTQLYDLDFVQSADVLYHLHATCDVRKLERYSDTCWRFRTVTFKPPPTFEYGARPVADLEVNFTGDATIGQDLAVTAHNADAFQASDVGREILVLSGNSNAGARAGIKSVSSTTIASATVCQAWVNLTAVCHGFWKITESPKTTATVSAATPAGAAVTVTLAAAGWRGSTGMTDTDCGRFAVINGGLFELTCIQSTTVANAIIRGAASSATGAQAGVWSLEESLWSTTNGFPETGDFFQDRLYLNSTYRLIGSTTSDYENFAIGVNDADAVNFPLNSKTIETIRAIVGGRTLQVFTAGSELVATGGGNDDPITPTNIRVSSETTHGSRGVQPIRIDHVTIFIPKGGRQVREFTIDSTVYTATAYTAPDLLLLANHLTRDATIVDMAYQREQGDTPGQIIWVVLNTGVMLACTYRREENVVAWSHHTTCGAFESVAVIPHPDGDRDQVWVTTRRTINGSTKRFVEYLDDCTFYYRTRHTDCCITCNPGSAVTVVGGLNHLAGQTVTIQGDGMVYPDQAVASCGTVTISPAASKIEVGLGYTSTVTSMRPEITVGGGSSMFKKMRFAEVQVKLFETLGMTIHTDLTSGTLIPFRKSSDLFGEPSPLFTGDKLVTHMAWDCAVVTVQQTQPLPSTILAIGGTLDVGD